MADRPGEKLGHMERPETREIADLMPATRSRSDDDVRFGFVELADQVGPHLNG